jgi:hypothetical protein
MDPSRKAYGEKAGPNGPAELTEGTQHIKAGDAVCNIRSLERGKFLQAAWRKGEVYCDVLNEADGRTVQWLSTDVRKKS